MAAHNIRKKGVATTFEIIRNYRELLRGHISRAEYLRRRSDEIEKPAHQSEEPSRGDKHEKEEALANM
jgi:hypothetical protein